MPESHLLWIRVAAQGQVGNHFLVGKLVSLRTLDDAIKDQDIPVRFAAGERQRVVGRNGDRNGGDFPTSS